MKPIFYIDRQTKQKQVEKVYKEWALRFLYKDSLPNRLVRSWISKFSFFSSLYGYLQKRPSSIRKIEPFIQKFEVDASEFLEPISQFQSFNDFFIRKLKAEARPICKDPCTAIIPADGRYYFYSNIEKASHFIVKGQKFDLKTLLGDASLAEEFREGSMALARLCPSDYHRFHFPCDCLPDEAHLINGWLYSVNPLAVKKNIQILAQNKRMLCKLQSPLFGTILYLEIGATSVGSIQETYTPNEWQEKGAEKGYFEFGGSALILLFQKDTIAFDADLLAATEEGLEIRCLLGQSMGKKI